MLPSHHRLTTKHAITSALRRGKRRAARHLVVHVAPSDRPGPARAAFAVSSAVGNSVVRHRVTRRLRAGVTPLLPRLPEGTDLVVRALPPASEAQFSDLVADLEHCLRHNLADDDLPDEGLADGAGDDRMIGSPAPPEVVSDPATPDPAHVSEHAAAEQVSPSSENPPSRPRTGLSRVLFILGTPLRWLLIGLVTAYRHVISPVLPPTCRYHPSCSAYALESLQVHGAVKGVALAAWRLGRCNPFSKGGLDPVPPRGSWRPDIHPDGTPRDPGGALPPARAVGLPDNPSALAVARPPEA